MARPLRFEIEDGVYHITVRGNERKDISIEEEDNNKKFITPLSEKNKINKDGVSRWPVK